MQSVCTGNKKVRWMSQLLISAVFGLLLVISGEWLLAADQGIGSHDRQTALDILHAVQGDLEKNYYDPTFHGVDMGAKFREAEGKIQTAGSYKEAIESIRAALRELGDPETRFLPRRHPYSDFGFEYQFYGGKCYVVHVGKGSDAERQGLKAGDLLLAIGGSKLVRSDYFDVRTALLEVPPFARVPLVVQSIAGKSSKEIFVETKDKELSNLRLGSVAQDTAINMGRLLLIADGLHDKTSPESIDLGNVLVWRQPTLFSVADLHGMPLPAPEDALGEKADFILRSARKKPAVVLDLRGNPGGTVKGLQWLVGSVFDHDVRICDFMSRGRSEPQFAKTKGKYAFTGTLIVMVDSRTREDAEVFARLIQIEKRGFVIGDQTAGRVMRERLFGIREFMEGDQPYSGVLISTENIVMTDGKGIEGTGVTPDLKLLPSADDLANGSDPVLAAALSLAGHAIDPEAAGKLTSEK